MPETHIGQLGAASPRTFTPAHHPEWFEGHHEQRLARILGVTQFGVNYLTLEPGAYSALRHWHEQEDEFVFVLDGELVLIGRRLVKDLGRWESFSDRDLNSHFPSMDMHRRLLAKYQPIWKAKIASGGPYDLTADEIVAVMREQIHPENRIYRGRRLLDSEAEIGLTASDH